MKNIFKNLRAPRLGAGAVIALTAALAAHIIVAGHATPFAFVGVAALKGKAARRAAAAGAAVGYLTLFSLGGMRYLLAIALFLSAEAFWREFVDARLRRFERFAPPVVVALSGIPVFFGEPFAPAAAAVAASTAASLIFYRVAAGFFGGAAEPRQLAPAFDLGERVESVARTITRFTPGDDGEAALAKQAALGVSDAFCDVAAGGKLEREADNEKLIGKMLADKAVPVSESCAYIKNGAHLVEIRVPARYAPKLSDRAAVSIVESVFHKKFLPPKKSEREGSAVYELRSEPAYKVEAKSRKKTKSGERVSGDTECLFELDGGVFAALLSDGMGSGEQAGAGSRFATEYFKRLVKNGVSFPAAAKLVSGALLMRDPENFATFDAAFINLNTGELEIYKAGAAPSFVIREGKVARVESNTLPAGVMVGSEIETHSAFLEEGDLLVMISDGIMQNGDDDAFLRRAAQGDRAGLADRVLAAAEKERGDQPDDDRTVIVLSVEKRGARRPVYAG